MKRLDHAAIGNGRVLALVAPTSAIEWLCMPRFDGPSVFGRLLDEKGGGTFRVLSGDQEVTGEQRYLRNTNVVRTRFSTGDASWQITDFACRIPRGLGVDTSVEIVRILEPLHGTPRLRVDFDPRPNYARTQAVLAETAAGIEVRAGDACFSLETNLPLSYVEAKTEFTLLEPIVFRFRYGNGPKRVTVAEALRDLELTVEGWRAWVKTCALPLFATHLVLRSALCLKLHVFEDTGAIIAAATTSVPEAMGTERTWDYRFCWLRDAAFVVEAFRRLGHLVEGERFLQFLSDVAANGPIQPLYAVDGARDTPESFLPNLAGFDGNGFVRIGNAAALQRQHDVLGELVLSLETVLFDPRVVLVDDGRGIFPLVRRLVEKAIKCAPEFDTSIWEFRSKPHNYTFSRAMCWAAIHRGARIATRVGELEAAERWTVVARAEQEEILRRGYNAEKGFFTQILDGEQPDASSLLLPMIGLIDAHDPRFISTLDAYAKLLARDRLMLRYNNEDDFGTTTSALTVCSFWWAEALALAGRLDEAVELFKHVAEFANPLGLFSEDIDPKTGRLLGNFPQAYTHVGLIHAATTIGELLDAREGRMRVWA